MGRRLLDGALVEFRKRHVVAPFSGMGIPATDMSASADLLLKVLQVLFTLICRYQLHVGPHQTLPVKTLYIVT